MHNKLDILDSSLRDGAQAEGIAFSLQDKVRILTSLDEIGIPFVEAGNPGSNVKDRQLFALAKEMKLKNSSLVAFGSTRRKNISAADDENLIKLLESGAENVAIFGKAWDYHVTDVLSTTLEENLNMIYDTIAFLTKEGRKVIFDAEHYFDGYKRNKSYALEALNAAESAGAKVLCLCDTNGGTFPHEITEITKIVHECSKAQIGIHTHNDSGMAVANTIMAVEAGATHIQGTFLGYGERCGNANLSTVIANLQLKKGYQCIPQENMVNLTMISREIAEISNVGIYNGAPYIGSSAFAHKGGMHVDAVLKSPDTFEHIDPEAVGNSRHILMSEVAGRSTIYSKIRKICPDVSRDSKEVSELTGIIKNLENEGFHTEGSEATFELLVLRHLGRIVDPFELVEFKVIEELKPGKLTSFAFIKLRANGKEEISAAEAYGPVNALDQALRKALSVFYPQIRDMHLTDYKVRVLDSKSAAAASVRVMIETSDTQKTWNTMGVSKDIIEASCSALVDSYIYKLIK